ncbi:MAG TPA: Gfo/Idh/MocA family oxidoreductase [Candidatus Dormibacteraeota bacterium]
MGRHQMSAREHGFGIVGCGVIAPLHAAAIADLDNAHLVAVADSEASRAAELGATLSVPDLAIDELLARPDVDVVCVCVPSGLHADVGVRAIAAGKHVLVEKPIDVTLEAADRLLEAARATGLRLGVISQRRWDPGVAEARELIAAGRLGRLLLGDAYVKWYRSDAYYASGGWRGTYALDGGGALMNQGVHHVDLLSWLMGPVESVFARTGTFAHGDIEVEDVAVALLRFRSGALGVIEASTAVYPGLAARLEISGTGGTLVIEDARLAVRELKEEGGETGHYGAKVTQSAGSAGAAADPAALMHAGHREQIADFLAAIDEGRQPAVSGADGRAALELVLAVYESARLGREVTLPLASAVATA